MTQNVRSSAAWHALLQGSLVGLLQWCFVSFWFSVCFETLSAALLSAFYIALPTALLTLYCHYQASRSQSRNPLYFLNAALTILCITIVGIVTYHKLAAAPEWLPSGLAPDQALSIQIPMGFIFGALGCAITLALVILFKRLQLLRHT